MLLCPTDIRRFGMLDALTTAIREFTNKWCASGRPGQGALLVGLWLTGSCQQSHPSAFTSCLLTPRRLHSAYEDKSNHHAASLPKQLAEATAIEEGAWLCERQAAAAADEADEDEEDAGSVRGRGWLPPAWPQRAASGVLHCPRALQRCHCVSCRHCLRRCRSGSSAGPRQAACMLSC